MQMEYFLPTAAPTLDFPTLRPSTGEPFAIANETFAVYIDRAGVEHRACQLSRGSTDTRVASTVFHYAVAGLPYTKAAVAAGTVLAAGTIPQDKWGVYLISIDAAGAVTVTAGAANFSTGYDNEAAAIAALPATPGSSYAAGFLTVQTEVGATFVGGTDALAGGASGNPANATNYYTLAERLASASPAGRGALTWGEAAYGTGAHYLRPDIALVGAGATADQIDRVTIKFSAGTVDSIPVVGRTAVRFGVVSDALSTAMRAQVQTEVEEGTPIGVRAALGVTELTVAVDAGNSAASFEVEEDAGAIERWGIGVFTSDNLDGEEKLVVWAGTTVTVLSPTSAVAGLEAVAAYSAEPDEGATLEFWPARS